ncbi:CHAP domain-containing protein [Actinoplanes missouriensis]|uniref:CHAP domain-containing protein n=1 Tax=Actinoplanes missouriensis TaxID=1866 RepID=UPI003408F8CC
MSVAVALLLTGAPAQAATRTFAGMDVTADGQGYLLISTAGEFYAFGNARPWPNPTRFSGQFTGLAMTADGQGAIAMTSAGQFYAYGTARPQPNPVGFSGQMVSVAITADGRGVLAMSSAGQFYAYGTARPQPNPVGFSGRMVSVSLTADGQGALAMSSAGQFYAYGTARPQPNPTGFTGSMTGATLTGDGRGVVAVSSAGQFYAYGSAPARNNPTGFSGGMAGVAITQDSRGMASMSGSGQMYAYGSVQHRGNGDPGSINGGDMRSRIVANATAELNNSSHNNVAKPSKCNFFSGDLKAGPNPCTGPRGESWRSQDWCADFGRWIWGRSGANTRDLSAGAISFKTYGTNRGTWVSGSGLAGVQPGDAIVYDVSGKYASHVGLVVAVGSTTVTTIDGNFSGGKIVKSTYTRGGKFSGKTVSGYTRPVA